MSELPRSPSPLLPFPRQRGNLDRLRYSQMSAR
mgnify:CR=1 FL=1